MKDEYFNLYLIPYSYLLSNGKNTESKKYFLVRTPEFPIIIRCE